MVDDDKASVVVTVIAQCRAEAGYVSFRAYRDAAGPDRFALHEQYAGEQALQEHRRSAHFARYFEGRVIPLLPDRAWSRYAEIPDAGAVRRERPRVGEEAAWTPPASASA